MEFEWAYVILVLIGFVAGTLNVIAGGGSFLTLPALMDPSMFALDATTANGTNRIGIVLQNVAATTSFRRQGVLDLRAAVNAAVPAVLGSGLGTWIALVLDPSHFKRILATLMVVISLFSLTRRPDPSQEREPASATKVAIGFFGVGLYGGFIQAGVGFFILAVLSMAGYDLVRGNAIKVTTVLCYTLLSVALFASTGHLRWDLGLALAVGTTFGGVLGARLTVLKGDQWVKRIVTVMIIVFAVRLWLTA